MGTFSIWHWLIVLAVVLLLFGGRGKISQLMGDFGKGLKSFKSNMKEDEGATEDQQAKSVADDSGAQKAPSSEKTDQAAKS
ncbi:MAG: twin-arginine translocase TatA/TatE family subunit [Alphaproteobacteria bacterium]|nr:twin-arginine translocase TatA/TatE family subunit [Alphaproteobacteria bacterium]